MSEATIAAISTPTGTGGISIVRMSGDKSKEIAKKITVGCVMEISLIMVK